MCACAAAAAGLLPCGLRSTCRLRRQLLGKRGRRGKRFFLFSGGRGCRKGGRGRRPALLLLKLQAQLAGAVHSPGRPDVPPARLAPSPRASAPLFPCCNLPPRPPPFPLCCWSLQVLQALQHKTYDLILMDIHMPGGFGVLGFGGPMIRTHVDSHTPGRVSKPSVPRPPWSPSLPMYVFCLHCIALPGEAWQHCYGAADLGCAGAGALCRAARLLLPPGTWHQPSEPLLLPWLL